jgi:hypothetical protein
MSFACGVDDEPEHAMLGHSERAYCPFCGSHRCLEAMVSRFVEKWA